MAEIERPESPEPTDIIEIPEFPKPFEITKWACVSSCFFLVPGTYAFYNQLYLYGSVCTYNTIGQSLEKCGRWHTQISR
jgi:hypothetical protein